MNFNPRSLTIKYNGIFRELRTPVFISTAFDPSKTHPFSQPQQFIAIWDTGATGSVISEQVVNKCGLKPIGMARVNTANGQKDCNVYLINIGLPNGVGYSHVRVTESNLVGDVDVLIGMDVINSGDFALTNKDGKTTLSFRVPSIECIDFVKSTTKTPPSKSSPKVGRNTPCPCGSGKKYKRCCGK